MLINLQDVLRKPMLTEKSMALKDHNNTYVFKVHPSATKLMVKEAVEKYFKVKVLAVRTMNFDGKHKVFGRIPGKRKDWKKALVVLQSGQSLEFI